jgi:peptidoglycan/LPS O-acetylase OafA/YrhL
VSGTETAVAAPKVSDRLRQLDGLRGVAALIVVVHHVLLLYPRFADTYQAGPPMPATGSVLWLLTATPLKVFTAGGEAVLVFFVMSGIVLTLPVLARVNFDWVAYYPRRMVRLYLPVIAAVLFAAVLILVIPELTAPGFSWWVNAYSVNGLTVPQVASAADVLFGDVTINNPLWSLRWEVLFSLALPLFIGVALLARRHPVLGIFVASALGGLGAFWGNTSFSYLPAFLIGAVIAVALDRLRASAARLSALRGSTVLWAAIAVIGVVLLVSYWLVRPWADSEPVVFGVAFGLRTLGATIVVVVAAFWAPAVRLLGSRFVQWLGVISFSLYLVHVPIALAAIHLFGADNRKWAMVATVVVAVLVAMLFAKFVEKPSHLLSKRVGALVSTRIGLAQRDIAQKRALQENPRD